MAASATVENKIGISHNFAENNFKDSFYTELAKYYESQGKPVIKPWTKQKTFEVIQQIKNTNVPMQVDVPRTAPKTYWHLRYDVTKNVEEDILIAKKDSPNGPTVQVVPFEDYYDILFRVHKDCRHDGDSKIIESKIKDRYIISRNAIELFVSLCPICKSTPRQSVGGGNTLSKLCNAVSTCGQIEVIDMQSVPDGQFKWILNYQDLTTKFVHLRPLCAKDASEIAFELLKIFVEFGVPRTLQSIYGMEFTAEIIEEIVQLWPECKIIQVVAHNTPSEVSNDECNNEDIENVIWSWMRDNTSAEWVTGCFFVQYSKNTSYIKVLEKSPFEAVFRSESNIKQTSQSTNTPVNKSLKLSKHVATSVNILPSSSASQQVKKRKIDLQESDKPKESENEGKSCPPILQNDDQSTEEAASQGLSQTLPYSKPKKQKTTSQDTDVTDVLTEGRNQSKVASPVYVVSPSPPYQNGNSLTYMATSPSHQTEKSYSPISLDTDCTKLTEGQKLTQVVSPMYVVSPSPPYQYATSPTDRITSPSYMPTSPLNQIEKSNPPISQGTDSNKLAEERELPRAASPVYVIPPSPTYRSTSPGYSLNSPTYCSPISPNYKSTSPIYRPTSPTFRSASPTFKPTSPTFTPTSATCKSTLSTGRSTSPNYCPTSPTYTPTSSTHKLTSPTYKSTSRNYCLTSPTNMPTSPVHRPTSPNYMPTSPNVKCEMSQNIVTSKEHNNEQKQNIGVERILQYLKSNFPITDIDYLFRSYAETCKTFSHEVRAEFKLELAKLVAIADAKNLQTPTVINGAHTTMDTKCPNR